MSSDNRTADEVRAEIAETRAELGDTAAALAAKADVKARVKESATAKKEQVKQAAAEKTTQVADKVAEVRQAAVVKQAAAVDEIKHQFTDGEPKDLARRPVPLATLGVVALAVAAVVVTIVRRKR